jgi:hypothetical protein
VRVEFRQGVPRGCIEWLWNNVGPGNVEPRGDPGIDWGDAWFYERVEVEIKSTSDDEDSNIKYVPTITVKDPKLAMLFVLRWTS